MNSNVGGLIGGKSKVASILLAVLIFPFYGGFWTWLYTYKKDGWKFYLGLGLTIIGFGFGIWIWAIVDTAIKSDEWYRSYS